jgi:hypothetical protein
VTDVRITELAGRQFNRISRSQLRAAGLSERSIDHRIATRQLAVVEQAVFAIPPVLDDDWGRWSGATLTAPCTHLSHGSASSAWQFLPFIRQYETVTRPGNGGPRRHGGLLVFRSRCLEGETTELNHVPITTVPRTLLDLARDPRAVSDAMLARALREAIRLKLCSLEEVTLFAQERRSRRGSKRLLRIVARYAGLPLDRARSGAEIRALEILRRTGVQAPKLNVYVAGEEADLVWPEWRLIIEVDGGPFHQDRGEDARKEAIWRAAGWTVRRIDSDDVYAHPSLLLRLATPPNVPRATS